MTTATCAHPNCLRYIARGRHVCPRHWFGLTEELQVKSRAAIREGGPIITDVQNAITEYFKTRMVGVHEVVKCRGSTCGVDIIWLSKMRGGKLAVNRLGVKAADKYFDHTRHTPHLLGCKNRAEFRRQ